MTLKTINQIKRNKLFCRILSIILVFLILVSSTIMMVSASTNSWGVETSQLNLSYFYSLGRGSSCYTSWEVTRQRCFYSCQTLVNKFNNAIVAFRLGENAIDMMNLLYHGKNYPNAPDYSHMNEAVDFGNKWNQLRYDINELLTETSSICGSSEGNRVINGKEVTLSEYQNLLRSIEEKTAEFEEYMLDLRDTVSMSFTNYNSGTVLVESTSAVNFLWSQFSGIIRAFGSSSSLVDNFLGITVTSASMAKVANILSGVTKTFAYAIAIILFGVNITTTALQYEILTLRGGIRVFARIILVKIWIDLAIPICVYILNIINSLSRQILSVLGQYYTRWSNYTEQTDDSWSFGIIGKVINAIKKIFTLINDIVFAVPRFILTIIIAICIILVFIKFIARALELTCLVSLSPLFFATLVGEETKRYFRRFISAFISTAGYIVYVSIVYAVGTNWIVGAQFSNTFPDLLKNLLTDLPRAIIIIGCCRAMVKPPKVLLSLTEGG